MSLLDLLYRNGGLRALDHALGQSLRRLGHADATTGDDAGQMVPAAAALASYAVGHGHAAFDPARPQGLVDASIEWPAPQAWLDALQGSRWIATPAASEVAPAAPLVLEHGLLYLRRYREYERRLAAGLQRLAAQSPASPDVAALAPLFAALFPDAGADDQQARAAATALLRSLLLITGGPGTGKTTTIARLLVLLVAQARNAGNEPPRIALAAPTGRAAERMAESLRHAATRLRATAGVDADLCDALSLEARTLHRLLGTIPDSPRFRHDAAHPLPFDVIVVDEASMVDLPLMCKLVEAVADGARLVLLGDPDQLPSVEAGDVLAAIVAAAGAGDACPAELAAALAPLLAPATRAPLSPPLSPVASDGGEGAAISQPETLIEPSGRRDLVPSPPLVGERAGVRGPLPAGATASALVGHRVHLQRGYRQSQALDLAPLAAAVRNGDADTVLALLRGGDLAGVHFHEDRPDPLAGAAGEALLATWRTLREVTDPTQALAIAARARLLAAVREGPHGARALNARVEDAVAGVRRARYFHGRLLLITENSYRHGLFNGDIGVCVEGGDGVAVAWFAGDDGVRGLHPAALPAHDGAFAMTVHKAQGSEFDRVWLQLPRADSRVLSRELLYTALTRARDEVHLNASEAVLRAALARRTARISGLEQRLRP